MPAVMLPSALGSNNKSQSTNVAASRLHAPGAGLPARFSAAAATWALRHHHTYTCSAPGAGAEHATFAQTQAVQLFRCANFLWVELTDLTVEGKLATGWLQSKLSGEPENAEGQSLCFSCVGGASHPRCIATKPAGQERQTSPCLHTAATCSLERFATVQTIEFAYLLPPSHHPPTTRTPGLHYLPSALTSLR